MPIAAMAQQQPDPARMSQALPYVVQQRNAALDAVAVCAGDLEVLQKKLKDVEAELAKKDKADHP